MRTAAVEATHITLVVAVVVMEIAGVWAVTIMNFLHATLLFLLITGVSVVKHFFIVMQQIRYSWEVAGAQDIQITRKHLKQKVETEVALLLSKQTVLLETIETSLLMEIMVRRAQDWASLAV